MEDNKPKLGLGSPPIPTYLFVGESDDKDSLWYELDFETDKKVPVKQCALWGRITGVKMVKKVWREEPVIKLDISIDADVKYVIRSSVTTLFSRGFLLSAQTLDDFEEMICMSLARGNEQNAIFCKLFYTNGQRVPCEWDKDAKLLPIIGELQRRLDQPIQSYDAVLAGEEYNEKEHDQNPPSNAQAHPPQQPVPQEVQAPPPTVVDAPAPVVAQAPTQVEIETSTPAPASTIQVVMPELIAPDRVPRDQQIPAPIARQARTLSAEYYSTEVDDSITLPLLGKIRSLARILKIDDVQECIKILGSDVTDLSVKGGDHFIAHLNRLVDEASK